MEEGIVPGGNHRDFGVSTKQKLYQFLCSRPAGADAGELVGLLFSGAGSDPELGGRIIAQLLEKDPNFVFDSETTQWRLRQSDRLRVPLSEAEFTVVDLETTGGSAGPGNIIEIGAYRMVGRRLTESFESLVRPNGGVVPRFITGLTSITTEMVREAPPIEEVLPKFREFMGERVMVAHNAGFDFGFLNFEYRRIFGIGLANPVLCTLRMARRFLPSLKRRRLDLLAEHFGLSLDGRHRGLGDARMAAEILSIFIDIAEKMGITRLDRLLDDHHRGIAGRRIERHVTPEEVAALPLAPGVYMMRNERGDLLYIGKARRLRERVVSYFSASVSAKTADLIGHVYKIETRPARSALEAALEEARLIRELKPPFNRQLKSAAPAFFVKLDMMDEFPRVTTSTKMTTRRGVMHLGPFIGRRSLDHSVRALSRILGLRTCAGRLEPNEDVSPCIYGQMGHCTAPCNVSIGVDAYGDRVRRAVGFLRGRSGPLLGELAKARDQAAAAMRFEEAGRFRRDLEALTTLAHRATRLSQVVTENNLVIVTGEDGDRAAHVVLAGRLAMTRMLDDAGAAPEVAAFVAGNYDRFNLKPVERGELESMSIVARWLRERPLDEGRLVYLNGPHIDRALLDAASADRASGHALPGGIGK